MSEKKNCQKGKCISYKKTGTKLKCKLCISTQGQDVKLCWIHFQFGKTILVEKKKLFTPPSFLIAHEEKKRR